VTQWQPIESAPKDGKWIIAFDGEKVMPMVWVNGDEYQPYSGWCYGVETWGGVLYDGYNEVSRQPTHWQPLPTPPEKL